MAKKETGFKKLMDKAKHPFDVLLDVAIAPGKLAAFAPLAPLFGAMAIALKKKNVPVLGSKLDYPENLARQFFQVIVCKKAPLTQAVGLASGKKSLENIDLADVSQAATDIGQGAGAAKKGNSQAENIAFKAADLAAENSGIPGATAVVDIIHKIIDFITGNKKKVAAGDPTGDKEMAAESDKAQDNLVSAGVGNLKSEGTQIADVPDYGHGFSGWLRKILHNPIHKQNLETLLQSLEVC